MNFYQFLETNSSFNQQCNNNLLCSLVFNFTSTYTENIILLSSLIMKDKMDINCGCIMGTSFNSNQKLFLLRKSETPQVEGLYTHRRVNKSTEFFKEGEVKSPKKSLKRRHSSNVSADLASPQTPTPEEAISGKLNGQFNISQGIDHKLYNPIQFKSTSQDVPMRTIRIMSSGTPTSQIDLFQKQKSYNNFLEQREIFPQPELAYSTSMYNHPFQHRHISHQFKNIDNQQISKKYIQQNMNFNQQPIFDKSMKNSQLDFSIIKQAINMNQKVDLKIRKSQFTKDSIDKEEERHISGYQQLKKRGENQNQINWLEKIQPQASSQEPQLFSPMNQQLFGRFAQSDDENCSQSTPSQVIGKGFTNQNHNFWEQQDGYQFEETLATRSTNTKFSQQNKVYTPQMDRPFSYNFGSLSTFNIRK